MKITENEKNIIIKTIILSTEYNDLYIDDDGVKTYDTLIDRIINLNDYTELTINESFVIRNCFKRLKISKTGYKILHKINKMKTS